MRIHLVRKSFLASMRHGLSLMEVLFAIGVLMVGLLGIASVLPVGTKNAAAALRSDSSASAIENQVSNAIGRFGGRPDRFDIPMPSQSGFGSGTVIVSGLATETRPTQGNQRFVRATLAEARGALPTDDVIVVGPLDAPAIAPAFCVDPAFLAAASNIRNDIGMVGARALNSYDRTKFPCYDINYRPTIDPGLRMQGSTAWPISPRMLRVSITPDDATPVPTDAVARVLLSERDGLPLTKTKDSTKPPGLFFSRIGAADRLDIQKSGSYSSIVTFVPTSSAATNYEVSVIVYDGRDLTTRILGLNATTATQVFPLAPFTSTQWPLKNTTAFDPDTYGDEVLGVVTAVEGIIQGGVGRFTFTQPFHCDPDIKVGQWIMLMRFDAAAGVNRYAWYRVSDIVAPPVEVPGSRYDTTIEVRGQDWLFHPDMSFGSAYPDPTTLAPTAGPFSSAAGRLRREATYIMKCPHVVTVRSMIL